ncbi:MAG TPA: hypothetical protein VIF83_09700 [Gemmatimonadaceae bacterium]|jgi:hypothetical protein
MPDFIARQNAERLRKRLTSEMHLREPAAFSKLARSTVEIALVTGVLVRLYRAVILTHGDPDSGLYIAATLFIGASFVMMMATAHLSRFALREWLWRAPMFAALEGGFEMVTSLGLIALRREPLGTGAATWNDWPRMTAEVLGWRLVVICVFAGVLAVIVRLVRYAILRREHSAWAEGTVRRGVS